MGRPSGAWVHQVAAAIADGAPVDWSAVERRAQLTGTQGLDSNLRWLAERTQSRVSTGSSSSDAVRTSIWLLALVAVCGLKVATAVALLVLGDPPSASPLPPVAYLALIGGMAVAGGALLWFGRHDPRATPLGVLFIVVGAAYSGQGFAYLPAGLGEWAASAVYALSAFTEQAFVPWLLWRFALGFPAVAAFSRPQRWVVWGTRVAGVLSAVLFLANVLVRAVGSPPAWASALDRHVPDSAFALTAYGWAFLALPAIAIKMRHVPSEEARRARVFLAGFAAGLTPSVAVAVGGAALPALDAWIARHLSAVSVVTTCSLLLVPLTSAYAVIVHRVLDVRVIAGRVLRYVVARQTLALIVAAPFVALVFYIHAHRDSTVAEIVAGPRVRWLFSLAVAGVMLAAAQHRVRAFIDRHFFREAGDPRRVLGDFADGLSRAATARGACTELTSAAAAAFHSTRAATLLLGRSEAAFADAEGGTRPLAADATLAQAALHCGRPIDVDLDRSGSPARLLPAADRQWLADGEFVLIAPIKGTTGRPIGLLALGRKRSDLPYSGADHALVSALAATAAVGIEGRRLHRPDDTPADIEDAAASDEPARECSRCGTVLPRSAAGCPAGCKAPLSLAPLPDTIRGTLVLERRLGKGGMGVVYLARDTELGRPVAIKTLPRVSPEDSVRLRREARLTAAITHPRLATVYGAETWRGRPLLITEFVPGGTLAERLAQGPLPIDQVLAIGVALAGVLHDLHAAGYLHRDIKPSNIAFDGARQLKLLDFGVAEALERTAAVAIPISTTGANGAEASVSATLAQEGLCGTPLYLSPELVNGAAPRPADDVWSASVVLYECTTGRHPFADDRLRAVLERILAATPPRPSSLAPGCPAPLDTLLVDALARDPRRRPQNALALRARLESVAATLSAAS